jgi:hypothetical protein
MSFTCRQDLTSLVPPHGTWVELGVATGRFAEEVLTRHSTLQYIGVDRWTDHHDEREMEQALKRLQRFEARQPEIHRQTFAAAALRLPNALADVVYVDGYAHAGQERGRTLVEWWPKVKPGGALAGHDYHERWKPTVKAVNEFAAGLGLTVEVVPDEPYPSWLIRKPAVGCLPVRPLLDPWGSVLLVGNGPSVLEAELGQVVDAFDEVIRFNEYRTQGFERHCGSKTTIWSTYGKDKRPGDENPKPDKCVFIHGERGQPTLSEPELWRLPISFYWSLRERLVAASTWTEEAKTKLIPSSGLTLAVWCLEMLEVEKLHFMGLDHFSKLKTGQHHYFSPRHYTAPREHDGAAEAALLAPYAQAGRLVPLAVDSLPKVC